LKKRKLYYHSDGGEESGLIGPKFIARRVNRKKREFKQVGMQTVLGAA